MGEFTCALICLYLPIDNYSTTATTDLNDTLDLLETFIFSLDVDCVIIGGDCNVDFNRLNAQTTSFNNFCKRVNMKPCVSFLNYVFNFTRKQDGFSSTIDALPVHIIRILFVLHYNLCIKVSWNGCFSESFYTLNGVKQGGILSPSLFSIFINDLLQGLESLGIGCFVGQCYYGSIAYADDIILLAPTLHVMRIMFQFCSDYASDNNILFNPNKSQCLKFCKCVNNC